MLAAGAAPVSGVVLAFTVLVTSIALVAGLAWASRQLLGAPVGTLRALIAGVPGLTHQFLLTLLSAATGIVAVLLIAAPGGPMLSPTVSLYQVIGYNLLIVASILVLRVLFAIFRNR